MAIIFACPHCGTKFTAKEEDAGVRGKCPACGEMTRIPSQSTWEPDGSPTPLQIPPVASPADGKRGTLWVVIGTAVPTLILAVFFTSLAWMHLRASRSAPNAQGVVCTDRSINPVGPKQPLLTNQQRPPPARDQNPPRVPPVNAAAAKSRIDPASRINRPPASVPPITPPPIEASLVNGWAARTAKLMRDYQPEMIPADNLDPRSGVMPWPIRVPMQGRVPNFPLGTEGIVHVGDDQFNKVRRLSESGAVGDGSIELLIQYDMSFYYDLRSWLYAEASRLYDRSIMAGDPVGIHMVIASGFAVRVKTGTRVRVVQFVGSSGEPLPRDGRMFRDVKILDGERSGVIDRSYCHKSKPITQLG